MTSRLIAALDSTDRAVVAAWAASLAPHCGLLKIGLEYFVANGPEGLQAAGGCPIFLDLKFHDIPNTVAGAVRAALKLRPAMLTLHAAGGRAMIRAAAEAAAQAASPVTLLAVTVLTSMDQAALAEAGVAGSPGDQVLRLADLSLEAGAGGLVCSAHEVAALRARFGATPILVVPGIRPPGYGSDDQARTTTPREAVEAGADFIVVGRPITGAKDPGLAARDIAAVVGGTKKNVLF